MNDRYLYRAKRTDNGEWITGYLLVDKKDFYICEKPYECMDEYSSLNGQSYGFGGFKFVDPSTICKCTGLKDKNGKLIWENDIVKGVAYSADFVGRIIWIEKIAGFGVRYFNNHREPTAWENSSILKCAVAGKKDEFAAEVIGNIFDNPELLEVGE